MSGLTPSSVLAFGRQRAHTSAIPLAAATTLVRRFKVMIRLAQKSVAALFLAPLLSFAAEPAPKPWETPALSVESGVLWEVGINTPLSYRLVPTQISWRSREVFGWKLDGGGRFLVRHRFTLLGTWIQQGPESHYVAFNGSPSIELWNQAGTWALVGGAGGGFGWLDSQAVVGGQGQDFTLNWFGRIAVEHIPAQGLHLTAGVMFQHMSNGGQTKPNPGIDAFGFTFGGSWAF